MIEDGCLPRIKTAFDLPADNTIHQSHRKILLQTIKSILPAEMLLKNQDEESLQDFWEQFKQTVPLFVHTNIDTIETPCNLSFYLLSRYRLDIFKFFFEMVSSWLIPGQRLNVVHTAASDFKLPDFSEDTFTLIEIMIDIENGSQLEDLRRNLPTIESELYLGMSSSYNARKILEIKGLSSDEKTARILEYIHTVATRRPENFDQEVYSDLQHMLVTVRDDFKTLRDTNHLSRIITIHYLFRKNLRKVVKLAPEKRHLSLKIFKARLKSEEESKPVLGIIVAINFLREKEVFEEKHLLKAIQNYLPHVSAMEGSFFALRRGNESICTLYLEIEKDDSSEFTGEEIQRLRRDLPNDLKDRIEHLMHPIFLPRNEEEIMRNILSLGMQVKTLTDMPQIFISFDEQTPNNLFFSVILVRAVRANSPKLHDVFQKSNTFLQYIHESTRVIGYIRKKHPKEATVFRVELPKEMFLRADHSIDLFKARQTVAHEIERVLGKVRDYNGGMISKQNELLCNLRNLLADSGTYNDFLLENFFYSLTPPIMRNVLETHSLKILFLMLLSVLDKGIPANQPLVAQFYRELDTVYVIIASHNPSIKDVMAKTISKLSIANTELGTIFVNAYDTPCLGYIYNCDDPYKQEHFFQTIKHTLDSILQSANPSLVPNELAI